MENQIHLPDHPDAREEYAHLQETRDLIDRELEDLENRTGARMGPDGEIRFFREERVSEDEVEQMFFRIRLDRLRQMNLSAGQAYFARLDFTPRGEKPEKYYLGRWGVLRPDTLEPVVVDWRSPVANLYYAGQPGTVDYEAPDGRVTGEMTLKRMLTVRDRELQTIFDTDVASQDKYLQDVLGSVTSDRLKEIVTTIQAEQNIVIRHPLRKDLLVQGAAGSGKTTIALHRIAYLLYTFRETLMPERMMILAPNPMFLSYISAVLPDLGVERVKQTTFTLWCAKVMGKNAVKTLPASHMERRLTLTEEEREREQRVLRLKGSLEMMERVDRFLEEWQEEMIPADGLVLSGVRLYTRDELKDILLRQLKPFPLAQRIVGLKKYLRKRLDDVCGRVRDSVEKNVNARLDRLMAMLPDGEERRARAKKLFEARDRQLAETERLKKEYLDRYTEEFPSMKLLDVCRVFLERCPEEELRASMAGTLEKGVADPSDLAMLCQLCAGIHGLKTEPLQHIVIDECQDFSPYQLKLLKRTYPAATMTTVGDLTQGIHEDEGTRDWAEWMEPVFGGEASFASLVTSYRNTVEIMEEAAKVAAHFPIPGVERAKPVLRHGRPVVKQTCADTREKNAVIRETVRKWLEEGYQNIALMTKTPDGAAKLYKDLKKDLPVKLITDKDTEYTGGVMAVPATLVKGMEFDCVLIADASKENFPEDAYLSRVLYVMMTRPLHCLTLLAEGEMTPLVD